MDCNIDDIIRAEINGVAKESQTNLRAHFLRNNEAIENRELFA